MAGLITIKLFSVLGTPKLLLLPTERVKERKHCQVITSRLQFGGSLLTFILNNQYNIFLSLICCLCRN